MAYVKRYLGGFIDLPSQSTAVDSLFLNGMETSLLRLDASDPTVDGQVLQWSAGTSKYGPALLLNKHIDPSASIDWGKVNTTGKVRNADVSATAAIQRSKLDFGAGLVDSDISGSASISASKIQGSALFTALPGSAVDGQEITLTDSTSAPTYYWRLRYNGTTTKWHFLGGSALYANVDTDQSTGTTGSYLDLSTVGPQVTVPVVGDYEIQYGSSGWNTLNSGQNMLTSLKVGAAATVDADSFSNTGSAATPGIGAARTQRKTALAASTVLSLQYKTPAATAHWLNRWIRVTPVKLG